MTRRTILFAAALVVALLATASIYAYVSSVNDRAIANAKPVEVLVAKGLIAAGTSAQDASSKGLLTLSSIPRRSVPAGALSDIAPVKDLVAISDIFPGEMLLSAKFSTPQTTGALTIPSDKIAVSVELQDPQRVAGFVVPGSQVAIFDTYTVDATGGQPATPETTRLLLAKVSVIAVGPTTLRKSSANKSTDAKAEGQVAITIVTVAVTEKEAEKLVHGAQTGKLYLGLLSDTSVTGGASRGLDNRNLFN
jgi:pilus assembly protein CpaB